MIRIHNGRDLESQVLGKTNTEDLRIKFAGRKPDFGRDLREIVSCRGQEKFPATFLASRLYGWVERQLKSYGVLIKELYFISSIGTMVDLYGETDCFFYLKTIDGQEAIVTIDLFFMEYHRLKSLREFWIEVSPSETYSQDDFHADLLRHSRMSREFMTKAANLGLFSEDGVDLSKFDLYREKWVGGYKPQQEIILEDPERGERGYENQLVVTPHHIADPFQRKVLADFIAKLLTKQIKSTCTCNFAYAS